MYAVTENGCPPEGCSFFCQQKKEPKKIAAVSTQRTRDLGAARPQDPNKEVAEGAGYANAVLLFALNARALCSDLKFGCSPEPPQGKKAPLSKGAVTVR